MEDLANYGSYESKERKKEISIEAFLMGRISYSVALLLLPRRVRTYIDKWQFSDHNIPERVTGKTHIRGNDQA